VIPVRVLCHLDNEKRIMVSVMVDSERYHNDDKIEEIVLELANETLAKMGKKEKIILLEVVKNGED
jgi:hypothetical protein